jgi:hypothetical protein
MQTVSNASEDNVGTRDAFSSQRPSRPHVSLSSNRSDLADGFSVF